MTDMKTEPPRKRNPRITDREWDLVEEIFHELKGNSYLPVSDAKFKRAALLLAKYREEVKGAKP